MLKGISGDGGGEVVVVDSGVASARGSACSMEWTAAELLDTTRGRTGGGERGYDVGTAAVASAMAGGARGGGAGEKRGCLGGSGERGRAIHDVTGRGERRGGEQVRGARCGRRRAPACLPGRQAARWSGAGLGRQVGREQASGKFFHFLSVFCFFNTSATLLNY